MKQAGGVRHDPPAYLLLSQPEVRGRGGYHTEPLLRDAAYFWRSCYAEHTDDRGMFADSQEVKSHDLRLEQIASPRTLAADVGFEPTNTGAKFLCLTAWLIGNIVSFRAIREVKTHRGVLPPYL